MFLPPRAPELNPVENIWQFMRDNWLSNRIFKTYDDIVALCCEAWNRLIRSTLEDHVDRTPKMGPWVLINARWYKAASCCRRARFSRCNAARLRKASRTMARTIRMVVHMSETLSGTSREY